MSNKVVELSGLIQPNDKAAWVTNLWVKWQQQRSDKESMW